MNLCDFLLYSMDNDSTAAFVDARGHLTTYGHLRSTIGHLAGFLEQATAPQDRCLIVAGNSFFWIAAYLATIKAGRVAVPVPLGGPEDQLERIARSCVPAAAFIEAAQMPSLIRLVRPGMAVVTDGPVHQTNAISLAEALAYPPVNRSRPTSSDMLASLIYATNAWDELRGIMVTHGNIIASVNAMLQCIPLRHADRTLCMAPLWGWLGTSVLHTHLRAGASLALRSPARSAEMVPEQLEQHRCTILSGTSTDYQLLLRQSDIALTALPHLRCIQHAGMVGARMSGPLAEQLGQVFRGKPIFAMYGQAETTAPFACLRPDELERKPTSIGRGIAEIGLTIVDPAGKPVPPGEVGRLVVHGPTVALGYWRDPAGSRRAFRGGQFHTGELARMDREGDVYLVGQGQAPDSLDGSSPLHCPVREVHYAALNFGLSEDSNATRLPFYWEENDLRKPED